MIISLAYSFVNLCYFTHLFHLIPPYKLCQGHLDLLQYSHMAHIWDYDVKKLKKSRWGRLLILERMINYGPGKGEKISLSAVKNNWKSLHLNPNPKHLMELLIWGKIQSSPKTKKYFYPF